MLSADVVPDVITYSSCIGACQKRGQWQVALLLLAGMPGKTIPPNVVSYASAMRACQAAKHWSMAFRLLLQMQAEALRANEIHLASALEACEEAVASQKDVTALARFSLQLYGQLQEAHWRLKNLQ